jgi:hypothetical protein
MKAWKLPVCILHKAGVFAEVKPCLLHIQILVDERERVCVHHFIRCTWVHVKEQVRVHAK